ADEVCACVRRQKVVERVLFHSDRAKVKLRFSVLNVTNKDALYNFLSTFTGTHFISPRAYQMHVGVSF
ncbi:MAG TPA: hypothetical protein VK504_19080, partial [Vicinamibacterales bacterium]|nr:hypothetical protein [Vicinamibacterales bacterium]